RIPRRRAIGKGSRRARAFQHCREDRAVFAVRRRRRAWCRSRHLHRGQGAAVPEPARAAGRRCRDQAVLPQSRAGVPMMRRVVTIAFALLAVIFEIALAVYWNALLEPRLRRDAAQHAQVLAQSQTAALAEALSHASGTEREARLRAALDQLL